MLRGWGGGDARERGLQARLRVDQEVRRGHDDLALREAPKDLEAGLELRAELDLPRLKPAPGPVHEHELAVAGGDHRVLRNDQARPEVRLQPVVSEHVGLTQVDLVYPLR